mmetsp:Transcript_11605/g.33443  ORF Transcript_11605/g.33443 Transcript_11605/m.33443 type:complete len:282 (+) Transcript_11605:66-911(+)
MSGSRSDLENLGIGMFCAPIFTVTLQPTIYLKHAKMQGLPLSMNPKMLWRGTTASMCNETGQAGLQFLTTGFIKRWAGVHRGRALTPLEDAAGSAAGGAVSALWVSPVELVMIQQQRFGGSVAHTLCRIQRNFGWYGFSRGYLATGLRDSVYVIGMLSATPFMEKEMKRLGFGAATGSVVASLAAGVAAGVLSCPFDCIKTCMKGDLERENFRGFADTGRHLYRNGGFGRLFHGVEWRCASLFGGFFVVSACTTLLDQHCPAGSDLNLLGRLADGLSLSAA